jgi:hypothetical protein
MVVVLRPTLNVIFKSHKDCRKEAVAPALAMADLTELAWEVAVCPLHKRGVGLHPKPSLLWGL